MIKAIKAFVDWLDRRFPAKVVVTEADYRQFQERQVHFSGLVAEFEKSTDERFLGIVDYCARTNARIDKLEESVKALKEALGKTIAPGAVSAEKCRADFIGSGRITD